MIKKVRSASRRTKFKVQNHKPLVSVIMPVYNAGEFVMEAVNSLLKQGYKRLELIAIDDGSTDNSWQLLKLLKNKDRRIKIIRLNEHNGVGYASNIGLTNARGMFVARMDADDIVPADRIEKQVNYLIKHPKTVVVGGQVKLVTKRGTFIVTKHFPLDHKEIMEMAFTAMPIQQGAMMVNRNLLPKNFHWYRDGLATSEDLDFFFRAFKYGNGANIPQVVLYYRQHGNSLTQARNPKEIFFQAYNIRQKARIIYDMKPGFISDLTSRIQYFLVLILPASFIYPLYYLWRGLRPFKLFKFNYYPLLKHIISYVI